MSENSEKNEENRTHTRRPWARPGASRRARRLATSLYANIRYGDREYIAERGLNEYLTDFLQRIQRIAGQIQKDYMGWKQ